MGQDISRRNFVAASVLALPGLSFPSVCGAGEKPLLAPKLRFGDTIGIVAPAGFLENAEDARKALLEVEKLGFHVKQGAHIHDQIGYLAGTDKARAADFNHMVVDDSVRAIMALRGGYGCMRMLNQIDYQQFRAHPKIVIGFSDVSALLVALQQRTGVTTFHGPVADSTFNDFSVRSMFASLMDSKPVGELPMAGDVKTLVPGRASGRLVGGNLSVLVALFGTTFQPDIKDAVLFLEDVNEDPYKIDRMLTTILMSPGSKGIKGLVFGAMRARKLSVDEKPTPTFTIEEVLIDRARAFGVPALAGLSFGHMTNKLTLPIGAQADLDADEKTLKITSSAVRD